MNAPEVLAGVAASAALAFSLGLQPASSPSTPTASDAASSHQSTERQSVALARQATRKFKALDVANQHGYSVLTDKDGIACIDMPGMGAMGVHYVNSDEVATPSVHVRKPEALVYERVHGESRLVALEYVVLKADWESVHGEDAAPPKLYGHRFDFTDAGNRYGLPPFYSLHAWLWKHNPAGRFAMWNPRVHCCCCGKLTR